MQEIVGFKKVGINTLYLNQPIFLFTECDIEYVDPSKYTPPDDGLPMKNGMDEDPYEKIVRATLNSADKQKVFCKLRTFPLYVLSLDSYRTVHKSHLSVKFFLFNKIETYLS